MITLTDEKDREIRLNDHLVWIDMGLYSQLTQNHEYTLTGALIIESDLKQAGRPITLSTEVNEGGIKLGDVAPIEAMLLENYGKPLMLKMHDNNEYQVQFSAVDGLPIEHIPLKAHADPINGDYIGLTLRFVEV